MMNGNAVVQNCKLEKISGKSYARQCSYTNPAVDWRVTVAKSRGKSPRPVARRTGENTTSSVGNLRKSRACYSSI